VDKSVLFETFYGDLLTAPMIKECPVNLECRVVKEFSIKHRQIFVGEVVQAHVNEEFVVEREGRQGIGDMTQLDPIIYALDNRYYSIGKPIGVGYKESKSFQHEECVSPYFFLDRITAPVQMMCGARDVRCPVSESAEARDKLLELGKPCELLLYEDEGHGFQD